MSFISGIVYTQQTVNEQKSMLHTQNGENTYNLCTICTILNNRYISFGSVRVEHTRIDCILRNKLNKIIRVRYLKPS